MSDDATTALVTALERLSRAQREAAARIAGDLGRPRAALGVVRLLRVRGPVQLCEVADTLRVDASVASRQVGALVEGGYVRRTVDETDRRARTLELTDAGHRLAAQSDDRFDAFVAEAFADWSAEDLADAIDHVRDVADAISSVSQEAPPR
ncbi:winged helix DNA-binding protein [Isoptericola sp. b515]|uniref:MarR family winged helix-turn-helix transcriptional regulator n=1 Tax=Isoptericola sp. b515 TaxID=3064652 RepID=UPI002712250E|nr:MarR family transcriptional regulator [Isoptericola sp. b515]MDO8147264.1 winged helix DNA-binding protein [Isoptericola sp. b515]